MTIKILRVVGARPNFMKAAPVMQATEDIGNRKEGAPVKYASLVMGEFHGVKRSQEERGNRNQESEKRSKQRDSWMNRMKKTGTENPMDDEVLDLPANNSTPISKNWKRRQNKSWSL